MAELNEKKNERLRAAFGISDSYVDGSSFDPQRRAREAKQPAPEPPKPYRYMRLVSVSLPNSKCFAPFFVCGLFLSYSSDFVLKLKCLRKSILAPIFASFHFHSALSGSLAVLVHQHQSKRRRKRRKIEDGKLVGKLF